jgi:peptidoglycan/LPS O-acetylase OafA/YrhL
MLANFVATVVLATLSWTLFEQPILRLKRRFQSAGHPLSV